jgi:CRISPR-associated protein (TIGR02584 family)
MPAKIPVALCLGGLSPPVVTEMLYALAVARRPRVIPREVHIITTHSASPTLAASLLGPNGAIARLRSQYRLPVRSLVCTAEHIHVMTRPGGQPLDDIRDERDSRAAGEFIGAVVRRLASDSETVLHCSLAGGRKTMSALLATALQLHGRPGDRLYHVLVNDPFERIRQFFFPPRPPVRYRLRGARVDSGRARVELAEVPFVRLGAVARRLGYGGLDLARMAEELEAEAMGRLAPEPLLVRVGGRQISAGERVVVLPPREMALYAFYANVRAACHEPGCRAGGRCARCQLTDDEVHDRRDDIGRWYAQAAGNEGRGGLARFLRAAPHDAQQLADFRAWLQQTRSRLKRRLEHVVGRGPAGRRYVVSAMDAAEGGGPQRRGLLLAPRFIRVTGRAP